MNTQELVNLAFNNDAIGFQSLAASILDNLASEKVAAVIPTVAAEIFGKAPEDK